MPDVPGEMFAPTEDHATLAIASALESFGRGRAVTFVDASAATREQGCWIVVCDQSHVRGVARGLKRGGGVGLGMQGRRLAGLLGLFTVCHEVVAKETCNGVPDQ
jgi:hypothetical protein